MKRRVFAKYDPTKEPIVREIEEAARKILRKRFESAYDLDDDEVACDIVYFARIRCLPYVSGGATFTAYPSRQCKGVTLHGTIPKPNKVFNNPEKWAQYIIDDLDKQAGGDVVKFWYSRMSDPRYNPYAPARNTVESTTVGGTNISKKFTKYPKNYVRANTEDVYIWDGESTVPKDVVHVQIAPGVTVIHRDAFYGRRNLESVHIPDTVKIIQRGAFGSCYKLNNIVIPSSVATIEANAFYNCLSLSNVHVSKNTQWHDDAFYNTPWEALEVFGVQRKDSSDSLSDWYSEMRSDLENENIDGTLAYDSKYADYFDSVYQDVTDQLSKKYINLFMEPSVQGGQGGTFVRFDTAEGEQVTGDWDFADECDAIESIACECPTLSEFKKSLYNYYDSKLNEILEDYNS